MPRKRIIVRGGAGAAGKVVQDLSAVYSFAVRRELVASNPVERAAVRKTDNQRQYYLSLEEVKRLGQAFDALVAEGVNAKAMAIARLWALTGCRHNEIAALRWDEVDLERGLLLRGDTKTGRSVRPLSLAAVAILSEVEHVDGSGYVFPGTTGENHYRGTKRIWAKVRTMAKLPDVTPYTLRHTLGSAAVSGGKALALTGAILGHSNPRSTAIYAHVQRALMKKAAERVLGKLAKALNLDAKRTRLGA